MLKRLELIGFKSFADKTHFDFPAGITAVVGPNGSGKSNIVDAVRWTLGEQSAKSLRGGEMADVIFNGSTSRRSLGLAEVTLTFDNSQRALLTEADEVAITRRVYRDGEGEYLINHQPSRLRDVKDLFLGTGAGTDAYSIIEQGKVDVLLQASTRERRTIFEEAAGISRFKAKKLETIRKLERVDQNLERLKDIIEEVEKQLRSVKLQAAKAQRYQEYNSRLQELRIALGLHEYQDLTERMRGETDVLDGLRDGLAERSAQLETWDNEARHIENVLEQLGAAIHEHESKHAQACQQIATAETTLNHETSLRQDLSNELTVTEVRISESASRVENLATEVARASTELAQIENHVHDQRNRVQVLEHELAATVDRVVELQAQTQADKGEHLERMRQAARLHNDAVSHQARLDHLRAERDRLLHRTEEAAEHLATLDLELQELTRAERALQDQLTAGRNNLTEQRAERERLQGTVEELTVVLSELRANRSGLANRIEVLEGLEQAHEGLGTGVREVLAVLGAQGHEDNNPWQTVLGIVAEFLTVDRQYAALIDLALGDQAQHFVVRNIDLLADALGRHSRPFSSRVSFVPMLPHTLPDHNLPESIVNHPGLVAIAADVVKCEQRELAALPAQLLGRTLIVRELADARALAAQVPEYRFVTLQGELLDSDGTLTVGTYRPETGILSRKSELRELRERIAALDVRVESSDRELHGVRDHVVDLDRHIEGLQNEISVITEQAADLRSRIGQRRERHEGLHEEVSLTQGEINRVAADLERNERDWRQAQTAAESADRDVQLLQARLDDAERELRDREGQRQLRQQEVTAAKVSLAQIEERLAGLRVQHRQLLGDYEDRQNEQREATAHITAIRTRHEECQRMIEEATVALTKAATDKELAERDLTGLNAERDRRRTERQQLTDRTQAISAEWRAQQEQAHVHELAANELRHQRDSVAGRLREDYQIELADLYQSFREDHGTTDGTLAVDSPLNPEATNEEIAELRRKLGRLGSVNVDSLQELAELQNRAESLQTQFSDLTAAKQSLEEIISTINADSRRLFTETFETVRVHFQELFRKLFGGGMADIILEDETDVLESGIEIIARPPGKELRSISLMSGGEKTLTAVAILLSIFRSKPSPFCILDEVDAALDEANIGRFTAVLRDFLDRSQFIIVTHSKKTMAVADVLYGVTMQESGVSKQVAVRFEDWVDNESVGSDYETVSTE